MTAGRAPRGFAGLTVDQALELLRRAVEGEYVITYDDALSDRWRAWRLGAIGVMIGCATPGELAAAIRADRSAR